MGEKTWSGDVIGTHGTGRGSLETGGQGVGGLGGRDCKLRRAHQVDSGVPLDLLTS
jgi:hypothetical protein